MAPANTRPLLPMPRIYLLLLLGLAACGSFSETTTTTRTSTTFARRIWSDDAAGNPRPVVHFDSAALTGGTQHTLDLGGGRTLVLDDLVGRFSTEELEFAAGLVRRCCEHVHTVTGIEVRGDVRYFLLPIDLDASSYEFEFRSDDPDRWAWVGFIAFDGAEGIARDGDYSLDFYEALVLTLPHERGETALSSVPTLQRENEGDQVNYGTRWFCDGGAQVIGSLFAQREFPQLWRADRERSEVRTVMDEPHIRDSVLDWSSANPHLRTEPGGVGAPPDEWKRYSAALLLMEVWTRDTPLREILPRIADHTGPVDGAALLAMVAEDTGLDRAAFLQAARALGHAEPSPRASIDPDGWDLGV